MKNIRLLLLSLLVAVITNANLKAQEASVTLLPGWNWISCPLVDTLDFATALGSFTPMSGDVIKSQWGVALFNNGQWRGNISKFLPGYGYMYKSNRTETIMLAIGKPAHQVVVITANPTDITGIRAVVCSSVIVGDEDHIFARGVCWDMEEMPTIDANHIPVDLVADSLCVTLNGLDPNTTYYVRAYAVTEYGLVYGNQQSFTTLDWTSPTGAIDGLFSVSANQQVYFSKGNLQYQASTNTWRFADNQFDFLGSANKNISSTNDGWIDLLGWGTSNYDHGANCFQPWSISQTSGDYYAYGSYSNNLYDQTGQADWGYNAISNGGDQENLWRTLTRPEWNYVFKTRATTSGIRYAMACVEGVNGVILLPDNWNSSTYTLNNTNSEEVSYTSNTLSLSQWTILENAGAVFLPAAGYRFGTSVGSAGSNGYYWTAMYCNSNYAYVVHFRDSYFSANTTSNRSYRQSVRLVCPAE